jgi:hypothetical protein
MTAPRLHSISVLATLWLLGCSGSDRELEARLASAAARGVGTLVQVRQLTDFEWDRLHIFPPYIRLSEIDRELGFAWPTASETGIQNREGIALLVFVRQGKVVRFVDQPRRDSDFASAFRPGGYSPAEAVFVVRESLWPGGPQRVMARTPTQND